MKSLQNTILLIFFILMISFNDSLGQSVKDIFNPSTPIMWLGLDFSKMKYAGDAGTVSGSEMVMLTGKINQLIIGEPKKYNINDAFNRKTTTYNLNNISKSNEAINPDEIISLSSDACSRLDINGIKEIVSKYTFEENVDGIGLVFIVECLNKIDDKGYLWITFIDMKNKNVLFSEQVVGKASGIGFRNHWAGSVESVLSKINFNLYDNWKRKYAPRK